jgi:C1A family cysteine protease
MELLNSFLKDSRLNFIVKKDPRDHRDLFCKVANNSNIKNKVDLREWCSPIEDQLHLGSCVGQAIVGAFELMINKSRRENFKDLSRLFVYYNARLLDGYVDEDVGAYVRDGIKAVHKWGVCIEERWPYLINKFADAPSAESYIDARSRLIDSYYRINSIDDIIASLSIGIPVVTGIQVFGDFDRLGSDAVVPLPTYKDNILGGHAVTIVGYDNDRKYFICRNSFGEDWGDQGYFYMPYDYTKMYAMDAWKFDIKLSV